MYIPLKLKKLIFLTPCALLVTAILLAGCNKDDNPPAIHYQLEGTWQLYKTTTGVQIDSIYEAGADNAIIFAPKFYWRYVNGIVSDSGTYSLSPVQVTSQAFSGRIDYPNSLYQLITIQEDTLTLSSPGVIANATIYIKSSDNSNVQ